MARNAFEIDKMYVSGDIKIKIYPNLMNESIINIYNYNSKSNN